MTKDELFNRIFNEHYHKIFRLCKGYFKGDETVAADAAQETFIKVWQNLETFRNEAKIGTWIYRIAVNTCLTKLRKKNSSVPIDDFHIANHDNQDDSKEEQFSKMYACIAKLKPSHRLIILMSLEGIAYTEIAEVIGITEQNLRVRIHRIKQQLIKCVQP